MFLNKDEYLNTREKFKTFFNTYRALKKENGPSVKVISFYENDYEYDKENNKHRKPVLLDFLTLAYISEKDVKAMISQMTPEKRRIFKDILGRKVSRYKNKDVTEKERLFYDWGVDISMEREQVILDDLYNIVVYGKTKNEMM
jgi:hypothetical protein